MGFWKDWFGKDGSKTEQDGARPCRMFMAVEQKSGRVVKTAKGLKDSPFHWGDLSFFVDGRLDEVQEKYRFIPDERLMAWSFGDIARTPENDETGTNFTQFLKGKKPEAVVMLREVAYRRQEKLAETDALPEEPYVAWCKVQDALQLKNSFQSDILAVPELLRQAYEGDVKEQLLEIISLYKDNDQYLPKILDCILALPDEQQRCAVYRDVEHVIEETEYYHRSGVEDITNFLEMPEGDMQALHVLTAELLRDELIRRVKSGSRFRQFLSLSDTQGDLEAVGRLIYRYHRLKGQLTKEDEQVGIQMDYEMLLGKMTEELQRQGKYDAEKVSPFEPKGAGEPVQAASTAPRKGNKRTSVLSQLGLPGREKKTGDMTGKPAVVTVLPDDSPVPAFDERKEREASLQRLRRGEPLNDELFRLRKYPETTQAQLEWALAQPYITVDYLLESGTMVGAVMNTRLFKDLKKRMDSYGTQGQPETFTEVEEVLVEAYAQVLRNDIGYLKQALRNPETGDGDAQEWSTGIKKRLLSYNLALQTLQPLLDELERNREADRLQTDINRLHELLDGLYAQPSLPGDSPLGEELLVLLFRRRRSRFFLLESAKEIGFFNGKGCPYALYALLAQAGIRPEYASEKLAMKAPDLQTVVTADTVDWLTLLGFVTYAAVYRADHCLVAQKSLERVEDVCAFFVEHGRKPLLWLQTARESAKALLELESRRAEVYEEAAAFVLDCFEKNRTEGTFPLAERLAALTVPETTVKQRPSRKKGKTDSTETVVTPTDGQTDIPEGKEPEGNDRPAAVGGNPVDVSTAETVGTDDAETDTLPEDKWMANPADDFTDGLGVEASGETVQGADGEDEPEAPDAVEMDDSLLEREMGPADGEDDGEEDETDGSATEDIPGMEEPEANGPADVPASVGIIDEIGYLPERDGAFLHPMDKNWQWKSSHVAERLGEYQANRLFLHQQDPTDNLRLLCLTDLDLMAVVKEQGIELNKKVQFFRMVVQWVKDWDEQLKGYYQQVFGRLTALPQRLAALQGTIERT